MSEFKYVEHPSEFEDDHAILKLMVILNRLLQNGISYAIVTTSGLYRPSDEKTKNTIDIADFIIQTIGNDKSRQCIDYVHRFKNLTLDEISELEVSIYEEEAVPETINEFNLHMYTVLNPMAQLFIDWFRTLFVLDNPDMSMLKVGIKDNKLCFIFESMKEFFDAEGHRIYSRLQKAYGEVQQNSDEILNKIKEFKDHAGPIINEFYLVTHTVLNEVGEEADHSRLLVLKSHRGDVMAAGIIANDRIPDLEELAGDIYKGDSEDDIPEECYQRLGDYWKYMEGVLSNGVKVMCDIKFDYNSIL